MAADVAALVIQLITNPIKSAPIDDTDFWHKLV